MKNKGLSLVELSIVMAIVAILATAVTPIAIRSVEIKAGEKAAVEMAYLQVTARKFYAQHDSTWPQDLNALRQAGLLNPQWNGNNPWGEAYVVSSASALLSVSTNVPQQVVELVAARLPMTSISGNTVTSFVAVDDSSRGGIASGVIAAWSGTINSIPEGWVLCDGNNGTPDLRDKFIVGARQDDQEIAKTKITGALSQSGGTIRHSHGGTTGSHAVTVAQMPPHSHGYYQPVINGRYDGHSSQVVTDMRWVQGETVGGGQGHAHSITADDHVPPYYALAFIMKLP